MSFYRRDSMPRFNAAPTNNVGASAYNIMRYGGRTPAPYAYSRLSGFGTSIADQIVQAAQAAAAAAGASIPNPDTTGGSGTPATPPPSASSGLSMTTILGGGALLAAALWWWKR